MVLYLIIYLHFFTTSLLRIYSYTIRFRHHFTFSISILTIVLSILRTFVFIAFSVIQERHIKSCEVASFTKKNNKIKLD